MSAGVAARFDPRAILASMERSGATYMIIGGLARVLRGADEITTGVDICPIVTVPNLARLERALDELEARRVDGGDLVVSEQSLSDNNVLELTSPYGALKVVTAPAGVPRGFVALRAAATKENLGHGLQPYVASAGDLAAMAAALHRDQDVTRLPQLRRIMELEVDRGTIAPPTHARSQTPLVRRESSERTGRRRD
ncbi:MAG TPA: hypothetical protein VHY18_02485 [Solirubrobacteraceae bacterium]|jgi:hypothetical protein|nr:hypothetical protein [Solirubrobacteraceae bacterium]